MPTFGDYETVGEPVAITDEGGRVSTVWQAKKGGGRDNRSYAIKCFAPHPSPNRPEADSADAPLDSDSRLEFLETVKQLKKARSEGGRCLAPIHEFGIADEGAWYAADYYKRSLKSWIALRGVVDDTALRHVVHSIAAACLSMKKSCDRSHGNVKVGNIFLAGKPQAFRKTPLELTDPRPGSMVHAFQRGASAPDPGQIAQLTEIHDLHAIGLIILQLVEGRIVRNEQDYNYPIQSSPYWNKLGKDAERWRQLCNQLLDPNLSLVEVNLESLAKQFRPSAVMAKLPLVAGGAVAVCAIVAGIYFVIPGSDKKFQARMQAAQSALDETNFTRARQEIDSALQYKPQEPVATELKAKIERRLDEEYQHAMTAAQQEFGARNWDNAVSWAKRASDLEPSNPDAAALLHKTGQELTYQTAITATAAALKQEDYAAAAQHANEALTARPEDMTAKNFLAQANDGRRLAECEAILKKAQAAFDRRDYAEAAAQADAALAIRPNDPNAVALKRNAQARQRETAAQTESERNYERAMTAAQAAMNQKDYSTAVAQAENALAAKPNDPAATKLKSDAQARQRELATQAENDRRYQQAMALAQTAFDQHDYQGAMTQADTAIAFRPNDPAAIKLKSDAQARQHELTAQAENERNYQQAMANARAAFSRKNYDVAATQADNALAIRPNDPDASQLKSDAQARQRELAAQADNDRKYREAMSAAQSAFAKQDYATTETQADAALTIRPNDPAASKLKSDAQTRQRDLAIQAENDRKYNQAINAAQTAFAKQDYATTIAQADAALAVRPGDSTAATLKNNAQTRQHDIAVVAEIARRYKEAMDAAQLAFNRKDYAETIARADDALKIKDGDAAALKLKSRATGAQDLQQAQAAFQQGNYDAAQRICDSHKGAPEFDALSRSIGDEQKALADARDNASDVSYSLIEKLKAGSYSQRPPFTALFTQEDAERTNLADLQQLKAAGQWQAVRTKLGELTPQGFLRKTPFDDLGNWATGQALAIQQKLQALDSEFEIYLVRFNVLGSREVFSPAARKEVKIVADMSEEDKTQYRNRVNYLEAQYKENGWLDKPGEWDKKKPRQEFLNKLKDHIENHS